MNEHDAIIAEERRRIRELLHLPDTDLAVDPATPSAAPTGSVPTGAEFVARMRARDRARRSRTISVVLAAAVALIVGALVVVRPWTSDPVSAATPPMLDYEFAPATSIVYAAGQDPVPYLNQLATIAQKADPRQGSGRIQLVVSHDWYEQINDTTKSIVVLPKVRRSWLLPTGRLDVSETTGAALTADGRGIATHVSDTLPHGTSLDRGTTGEFPAGFVRNLPTDPSALASALLDHANCASRTSGYTRSMCLYHQITNLYSSYVFPPRLNAALWRMLAKEKGFTTLGSVRDRANRPGLSISITDPRHPQYRNILIISVANGTILGDEQVLIQRDATLDLKPPAVVGFTTVTSSTWVTSAP